MKKLFFVAVLAIVTLSSCFFEGGKRVRGNGTIKTMSRNEQGFENIEASGAFKVYLKQDSAYTVNVEADENLQDHIEVYVNKTTLVIKQEKGYNLRPTRSIKIYVSAPLFHHLDVSGASNIYSENRLSSAGEMYIDASGASGVEADIKCPKVSVEVTGASNATLTGETRDLVIDGSGASNAKCYGIMTENANVEVSGASNAQVFASVKLDAHASGASDIRYKGNATVSQDVSGASSVKKVE